MSRSIAAGTSNPDSWYARSVLIEIDDARENSPIRSNGSDAMYPASGLPLGESQAVQLAFVRVPATIDDVARMAMELPEVTEGERWRNRTWSVEGKGFVWERPLRVSDRQAVDADLADGPILAARVADEGVKAALAEVVVDAWLARAPARLVKAHPEVSDLRPSP